MISEALASIIFSININAILIRDYSEVKDKITSKTIALLIDENIINKGKRIIPTIVINNKIYSNPGIYQLNKMIYQ